MNLSRINRAWLVDATIERLRRINRAGLRERLEVQLTLEVEAARLAAACRNSRDLESIRAALEARAHAGNDTARIEHDERFHRAVVEAAHNDALGDLYRYFASAIRHTIEHSDLDVDLPEPTQADHARLFDAIVAGDRDAAAATPRALLALLALLAPSLDVRVRGG